MLLGAQPNGLPVTDPVQPEIFKDCGYRTHMVGKWHLGFYDQNMVPEKRGFESHYGYLIGAEGHYNHSQFIQGQSGVDFRDGGASTNSSWGQYSADLFAKRVEDLVEAHDAEESLYMYVGLQNVHYPLEAPQHYVDQFSWIKDLDRRIYAAMTKSMDDTVGRIINSFKNKGIWEDTIVYFTTDNGGSTLYGGNNWPLRGLKNTLWEGGIRGIGSIKIPGVSADKRDQLMHVVDMFPTLLDLTSCPNTRKVKFDGKSQAKMLVDNDESQSDSFLINIDPLKKNKGADNRTWDSNFDVRVQAGLRWKQWKLLTGAPQQDNYPTGHTYPQEWPQEQDGRKKQSNVELTPNLNVRLYDISSDPLEDFEISNQHTEIVEKMLDMLSSYNSTAVPCRYPKPDPAGLPDQNGGFWKPWINTDHKLRFHNNF